MRANKNFSPLIPERDTRYKIRDTKKNRGLLFIISGPSGVGKGTLRKKIFKIFPDLRYSVSVTTRSHRKGEREGVDYYFVSENEFKKMIEGNKFAECALVHGDYKGTPLDFMKDSLQKGEDVLLEIDVQGAMQIKERFPEGIFIFIAPPSWKDLEQRLRERKTEQKEDLEKRLKDAHNEMRHMRNYNYLVVNDELKVAIKKLKSIIIAERCKIINNKTD